MHTREAGRPRQASDTVVRPNKKRTQVTAGGRYSDPGRPLHHHQLFYGNAMPEAPAFNAFHALLKIHPAHTAYFFLLQDKVLLFPVKPHDKNPCILPVMIVFAKEPVIPDNSPVSADNQIFCSGPDAQLFLQFPKRRRNKIIARRDMPRAGNVITA